jgi:hypothetical protein
MRFPLFLAAALGLAASSVTAQTSADLIVKLRDPHSVGTAEARDAAAGRLSERAGLELRALGVTSGGELLLGIDQEALAGRLMDAARTLPGVVTVARSPGSGVIIETQGGTAGRNLASISGSLTGMIGAPVAVRTQGASVVAEATPDDLVDVAAQRLEGLPEVSYAQPNLRVGIQPPDPPIMKPL